MKFIYTTLLAVLFGTSYGQLPDVCDSLTAEFNYTQIDSNGTVAFWPKMNTDWSIYTNVGAMVAFYDFDGGSNAFDTIYHQFQGPGKYEVCLYISNEQSAWPVCDSLWCDSVEVVNNPFLSITENRTLEAEIYPNPMQDQLTLKQALNEALTLSISNTLGQVLQQTDLPAKQLNHVDVSEFKAGVYLIHLQGASGSKTFRILKE